MVTDDCTDLAAHAAGDLNAFGRLYDRHASIVLSLCTQHAPRRSAAEGEDALQETFTRAFRKLDTVEDCSFFGSWLYQIARFVCAERRRSDTRRQQYETAAAKERSGLELVKTTTASDVHERAEDLKRLDRALDALSENERLAIHLHFLDSNPTNEARRVLGLSRSGYYKTLEKARQRLASLMAQEVSA